MTAATKQRPGPGALPKLKYSGKDLQVRVSVLPPGHQHQYTINFRCMGAKGAGSPSDFMATSMYQIIGAALQRKFGGILKIGGRDGVDL